MIKFLAPPSPETRTFRESHRMSRVRRSTAVAIAEIPLTKAQRSALEASSAVAAANVSDARPAPPADPETRQFLGWRVPAPTRAHKSQSR